MQNRLFLSFFFRYMLVCFSTTAPGQCYCRNAGSHVFMSTATWEPFKSENRAIIFSNTCYFRVSEVNLNGFFYINLLCSIKKEIKTEIRFEIAQQELYLFIL